MAENMQAIIHTVDGQDSIHFLICQMTTGRGEVLRFYTRPNQLTTPLKENGVPVSVPAGLKEMDTDAYTLLHMPCFAA